MDGQDSLIEVFAGTEMAVYMLKGMLEEIGVAVLIRINEEARMRTGFFAGTHSSAHLLIQKADQEKAVPVIQDFLKSYPHK